MLATLFAACLLGAHIPLTWANATPGQGCTLDVGVDSNCNYCVVLPRDPTGGDNPQTCDDDNACTADTCTVADGDTFPSCNYVNNVTCPDPAVCRGSGECIESGDGAGTCTDPVNNTNDADCDSQACIESGATTDECSLTDCQTFGCAEGECRPVPGNVDGDCTPQGGLNVCQTAACNAAGECVVTDLEGDVEGCNANTASANPDVADACAAYTCDAGACVTVSGEAGGDCVPAGGFEDAACQTAACNDAGACEVTNLNGVQPTCNGNATMATPTACERYACVAGSCTVEANPGAEGVSCDPGRNISVACEAAACNAAGECAISSLPAGEQDCPLCQACQGDPPTCQPTAGAPCDPDFSVPDGVECFCSGEGEPSCDLCRQPCPTTQSGQCVNPDKRFCSEEESRPGQATCGDVTCSILCTEACGEAPEGQPYTNADCNNERGCSCKDAFSVFEQGKKFTGPCCQCVACPEATN